MFIKFTSLLMLLFILISIYLFINKNNNKVENFSANDNQKIPKNNFTKQFLDKKTNDNLKLNKLVKSYEKLTPCCGGYYVPTNFGFNFD